jgi:hypothetical protein
VSLRRNRKAATLAIQATELAAVVPLVVAHRLSRMALARRMPTGRDHRELTLMGTEKMAAFYESWNAIFSQSIRIQQEIVASLWRSFWLPWLNLGSFPMPPKIDLPHIALRVLSRGMAPVRRRAVANAKRLSRTKFR